MLTIFLALATIYILSPVRTPYDSRWSLYTAMSWLRGHDGNLAEYEGVIRINDGYAIEYRHGKPYDFFPIGASVFALPAVAAVTAVHPGLNETLKQHSMPNFEAIIASIWAALAGALFFSLLRDRFAAPATAIFGTVIFAFCTTMWSVSSRALWAHGPLALMFVIMMLLFRKARRSPALVQFVGPALALAFVVRPTAATAIVVISVYVLIFHRRLLLPYLAWAAPIAIVWIAYNHHLYDGVFPPYFDPARLTTGSNPTLAAVGILISPARGLFIYSPVLLLALPGFFLSLKDADERWLHASYMAIALGIWIGVAHHYDWFGGDCYGPRFMTDIVPFLAYFSAFGLDRIWTLASWRRTALLLVGVAGTVSFLIHAAGAISPRPYAWNAYPRPLSSAHERLWDWGDLPFLRVFSPISHWIPEAGGR